MPRNGSGTYTLPAGNPVVPGTVISSSGWANPTLNDMAAALTGSWALNGEAIPTANQSLGNFRLTNVGNAINRNEYAAYGQVQDGQPQWMTVSGTDTIIGTIAPGPTGYVAGQTFRFVAAGTNTTTSVTLNINSLGSKNVTKNGANALQAGDLISGVLYQVVYDGTQFQLSTVPRGMLMNVRVFSTPGSSTYTPTPGTSSVIVDIQGGGGGGGGSAATAAGQVSVGGAGAAGGFVRHRMTTGFSGATVVVGIGGTGVVGASGNAGSASSFAGISGGGGGPGASTSAVTAANGASGTGGLPGVGAGGSVLNISGQPGAGSLAGVGFVIGHGGGSKLGAGGYGFFNNPGSGGTGYGSGGGGSGNGSSQAAIKGGDGSAGAVIIYEYS